MSQNPSLNRRQFITTSGKLGLGLAALSGFNTWTARGRILGANDRIRLAVCGVRKRGFDHVRLFSEIPNVSIEAICDIDENVLRERVAKMEELKLPKPRTRTHSDTLVTSCGTHCTPYPHPPHSWLRTSSQAMKDSRTFKAS